jgi:hypothetical protein
METRPLADRVIEALTPYLGAFNARVTVKTFTQRTLRLAPEGLTVEHLPALLEALRPTLYTFVGKLSADALLDQVRKEVK